MTGSNLRTFSSPNSQWTENIFRLTQLLVIIANGLCRTLRVQQLLFLRFPIVFASGIFSSPSGIPIFFVPWRPNKWGWNIDVLEPGAPLRVSDPHRARAKPIAYPTHTRRSSRYFAHRRRVLSIVHRVLRVEFVADEMCCTGYRLRCKKCHLVKLVIIKSVY